MNERKVNFLLDRWTPTKQPIFFNLAQADTIFDIILMVRDMVNVEGKWNIKFFQN